MFTQTSVVARWGATLIAAATITTGCDAIREFRAAARGEDSPGEAILGDAGLRVEIEPPDGITILLDGVRVSSMSPYSSETLKAGSHLLEVRAMGYYSFTLPLQLTDHETITVPVALRRRPRSEMPAPAPPPQRPRRPASPQKTQAPPPPKVPEQPAPEVPAGVDPIVLYIIVRPEVPIKLDGLPIEGRSLTLNRVSGRIGLGGIDLPYRIGGRGLLFFTVPADEATWTTEGRALKPGSRIKHHKGVIRIERTAAEGRTVILMKR